MGLMPTTITDGAALLARAAVLAARARPDDRAVLGITGAPGAGKSTLAARIVAGLGHDTAVLVPMDGFHLTDALLRQLGRSERKGAPDTFDADAFVDLLRRLRLRGKSSFAPVFDRARELAEVGGMLVPAHVPLIVTEGNYLLLDAGPWQPIASLLDECWFVDLDDRLRRDRLRRRHEAHGWPAGQAAARTLGSDEANAVLVTASRDRADVIVATGGSYGPVTTPSSWPDHIRP